MNKQEIEKAIEVIKKFKHFADLVESPDEYFQHMQGHTKELSLVLNVFDVADLCDDIVKLLNHQLTNRWIPVSERLPVSEDRVLICADRKFQDGSIIQIRTIAMYEDGGMHTRESGFMWEDDIDFEYDEETDDFIIPEGWWEQSMYCEEFDKVDDFVTHWQPLPPKYKEVSE